MIKMADVKVYTFDSNPDVLSKQLKTKAKELYGDQPHVDEYFWEHIWGEIELLAGKSLQKTEVFLAAIRLDGAFIKYLRDGGCTETQVNVMATGNIASIRLHQIYSTLFAVGN